MKKEDVDMNCVDLVVGLKGGGSIVMATYDISYIEAMKAIESHINLKDAEAQKIMAGREK